MSKAKAIFVTFLIWCLLCGGHAYYWTTSILSQSDLYGYERSELLILIGFIVYRFPFWLLTLFIVAIFEMIMIDRSTSKLK